ncbi:hypothetical protein CYY_008187 [Polysphondylium violaceum]|uniref:Ubiquitin-like-conjugating enzyme ATG10 n=1 Tax=Polysphondylium violaceum TaxID=133409 RepID=A0A8J4PQS0_9MYCE|nr:hypothetical protein CYY_008187 [Polysphondylium violaceum]
MTSFQEFKNQALSLINGWNEWCWVTHRQRVDEDGYLVLKLYKNKANCILTSTTSSSIRNDDNQIEDNDIDMSIVDSSVNSNNNNNNNSVDQDTDIHIYEYHVIFSRSYQVPVLYLNVYKKDSTVLSWSDIWNTLPLSKYDSSSHNIVPYFSQVEHPILGIPFYQLHPCETPNLMKQILSVSKEEHDDEDNNNNNDTIENLQQYFLSSWLSIVSPLVGINIPLHFLKYMSNK